MAAASGASYLGVIFAGGPRMVTPGLAREIVAAALPVPVFGVFGATSVGDILRIIRQTGLAGAQLHGVDPEPAALGGAGVVWRVRRVATAADLAALAGTPTADAVLVEAKVAGAEGGTGVVLDRSLAVAARAELAGRRMALAGGLHAGNVAEIIGAVRPDIVDVSTGVELPGRPGIKDAGRIRDFLEAVRGQ